LCIIFSNLEKSGNTPYQIKFFKIFGSKNCWNSKPLCEVWWNHSIAKKIAHLVSDLSRLTILFSWMDSTSCFDSIGKNKIHQDPTKWMELGFPWFVIVIFSFGKKIKMDLTQSSSLSLGTLYFECAYCIFNINPLLHYA
jgi:hypothetical protein